MALCHALFKLTYAGGVAMRGKKGKIRELYKEFKHLRKSIESNITKLDLSLENELKLFISLDNIKKLLDKI
jgi:hypothetical protein